MPSVGGALELVGVRAVILDIRQYLADGRKIEQANKAINDSVVKIGRVSRDANNAASDAFRRYSRQVELSAAATDKLAAANAKLSAAQAALTPQPVSRLANGQFAPRGTTQIPSPSGAGAATDREIAKLNRELAVAQSGQLAASKALEAQEFREGTAKIALERNKIKAVELEADAEKSRFEAQATIAAASRERRNIATSAVGIGGALVVGAGAAAAIASASKFQQSLVKIDNLTSLTTAETNKLGGSLLDLSKAVPNSPDELGAAAFQVLSSGIKDTNQALAITRLSAEGAAIGLGDAKDVASTITSVINAYGKENITAAQASDILVAAVREGKGEASDFAGSLGRVIGVASNVGVKFDELAASLASLTNIGLTADEATTAILGVLNQLEKDTPAARQALASVGLTIEGIRKSIQEKGFVATMRDLAAAFQNNSAALQPIIPNVRAINGLISAFIVQGQQTSDILQTIRRSAGVTDEAFQNASKTFDFQAKLLRNQLTVALIEIGTSVLPQVTSAFQSLIRAFEANRESITKFAQEGLKGLFTLIGDVARGIVILVKGMAALEGVLDSIVGKSAAQAAALTAIGIGLTWALPGGPYIKGLIIIAGLLGAIGNATGPKGAVAKQLAEENRKQVSIFRGTPFELKSGGALNKLILGSSEGLTDSQLEAAKAADKEKTSTDFLAEAQKNVDKFIKNTNIDLPDLNRNVGSLGNAAEIAAEKLKKAEKDFATSSEAAGEFESFTDKLKLFGQISAQEAKTLGLSAIQAGNVQGIDAVARSEERASAKAFQFTEALAAVAKAFQTSAKAGEEIVLGLARSALEASRQAASQIFSRPTREVVNLGIPLALARQRAQQVEAGSRPALNASNAQLKAIERQIAAVNKAQQLFSRQQEIAQKAAQKQQEIAQKQRDAAKEQAQKAAQAAQDAAQRQLDQLKFSNLQAQIAYERINANLQDLIDANTKQISDLQEAFLKSNEDLQRQINAAIGRGDTGTALALTSQQQAAAKAFQSQQQNLTKTNQNLTFQQNQLKKAEDERQRAAQLAEAALELQTKQNQAITDNTSSLGDNTDALGGLTDATDTQSQAYQDQLDTLNSQRDAIQANIDKIGDANDKEQQKVQSIQDQIDAYQASTDVLKAQVDAADRTILTQSEQAAAAATLITQIGIESQAVRELSGKLNQSFIPGMDEATRQFDLLQKSLDIINNPNKLIQFIDTTFDAGAKYTQILNDAAGLIAGSSKKASTDIAQASAEIKSNFQQDAQSIRDNITRPLGDMSSGAQRFIHNGLDPATNGAARFGRTAIDAAGGINQFVTQIKGFATQITQTVKDIASKISGSIGGKKNAYGGIYSTPTNITVGEEFKKEVVLPLAHPQRARELLAQVPPAMLASLISSRGSSSNVFAPTISVTGETLDSMEATAIRAVQRAFRDARSTSQRSGALIGSGLGPSR